MEEIKQIKITDKGYLESLKKISGSPEILYYKGILPKKNEPIFAVVGTRRPTPYGKQVALQIAGELADSGITIVSGMAPGIDTEAHRICVEKNKRTIAVLGTGLHDKSIYPQENLGLSRQIVKLGGCLISELPPGTPGSKFTFPKRNRIISGLSLGVLVVEAKEKSGSLITSEYAKKQGKKVFAIPGPIFSLNSEGPNNLIKNGAFLASGANDILKELNFEAIEAYKESPALNNEEKLIIGALREGALYIDNIIEKTRLNASRVASCLANMEILGNIRNLGGNIYSINK